MCRLWRIHQALYCFGYDLEENRDIKDMLLECFINVNYIKKEEVSRFFFFLACWWAVNGLFSQVHVAAAYTVLFCGKASIAIKSCVLNWTWWRTWGAETDRQISETSRLSLVYKTSSRSARTAIQRNPVLKASHPQNRTPHQFNWMALMGHMLP